MEPNEQQNKSTRTYEEWKAALQKLVDDREHPMMVVDDRVKPYYDQGLMPDVCYQELFNR